MKSSIPLDQQPLSSLKGVGPALAQKLAGLGLHTVQDLLFHLPYRYQDRTRITPIADLQFADTVQIEGELVSSRVVFGRRRSLQCVLRDSSGQITLRFFFFSPAQQKTLQPGVRVRCYGEVRRGRHGLEIYHPEYRILGVDQEGQVAQTLTPLYPATEQLQQSRLRALVDQALPLLQTRSLEEFLPAELRAAAGDITLADALRFLHHPPSDVNVGQLEAGLHPAQRRLAYEELLTHRLAMRRLRLAADQRNAPALIATGTLAGPFEAGLPFTLTDAQRRAWADIAQDLSQPHPMLRLLQGDVGSGKTLVAALAALQAVESGHQAVIMAPTEILAEQHFHTFQRWLSPLQVPVGWLSGKLTGKARQRELTDIADGTARVVVGTHALFQDEVRYARLGLVIIDEQHRFGVHQRMALRDKADLGGASPHQLVMTATPIPRTLAMSAYADLDCSVIDELPPGRTPVTTLLIDSQRRDEVVQRIHDACRQGSQAYWVCTLIDESEALQCQAAEATAAQLTASLPALRIGLVHGRMKPKDKAEVMAAFKSGALQLLVATTVIEVGVDVPNASVMVIENPERLGLAQLHQLRGRVGRGAKTSYCLLLYQPPLSQTARQRLAVMKQSNDGFYIAEQDLQIRGPGEVLGTQQTGLMRFRVADLGRDAALLEAVQTAADTLLTRHPDRVDPLIRRWLGDRAHYGKV